MRSRADLQIHSNKIELGYVIKSTEYFCVVNECCSNRGELCCGQQRGVNW